MIDITEFGVATVPTIAALCYFVGALCKRKKFICDTDIPTIVMAAGIILGCVGKNVIPEFPANDYLTAAAVGAVSGMAATWANQTFKQCTNDDKKSKGRDYDNVTGN